MLWDSIPVPKGTDADFAVAVTDDSLAPDADVPAAPAA